MSLTGHIRNRKSPVRSFLYDRFPNTKEILKEARAQVRHVETIWAPDADKTYPYELIGTALDYRLRFYFEETPLRELVAYKGIRQVTPTAVRLLPLNAKRVRDNVHRGQQQFVLPPFSLEVIPPEEVVPGEVVAQLPPPLDEIKIDPEMRIMAHSAGTEQRLQANYASINALCGKILVLGPRGAVHPRIEEFAAKLRDTLSSLQPVGNRLEADGEELLARYCLVLALYERIARSGQAPETFPKSLLGAQLTSPLASTPVVDLLSIPESSWVQDMCNLSWAFYDSSSEHFHEQVTLNPAFDGSALVGGADADIILGDCLVEFKATIRSNLPALRDWLYQLIGYVLLDFSDKYRIRSVAIYLPRQRIWLRWSLADLISTLTGVRSAIDGSNREVEQILATLRSHFKQLTESLSPGMANLLRQVGR